MAGHDEAKTDGCRSVAFPACLTTRDSTCCHSGACPTKSWLAQAAGINL